MRTLLDNEDIKVTVIENESSHVTLCFTGIGHNFGGVDVQSEEFLKSSATSTSFFIVDKKRTWGNNIDFDVLHEIIEPYCRGKTINSIGNSMGGFLAILVSKFFNISSSVAFVPQFSVSKKIIPTERRWDKYVNHITQWRFESLADSFNEQTQYYIFAGTGGADDRHLALFPSQENIHKIYFNNPKFLHSVANNLKSDGLLYPVIADCFNLQPASKILGAHLVNSDYAATVGK